MSTHNQDEKLQADSPIRYTTLGSLTVAHDQRDGSVAISRDLDTLLLSRVEAEFVLHFLLGQLSPATLMPMSQDLLVYLLPNILKYAEAKGAIQPPAEELARRAQRTQPKKPLGLSPGIHADYDNTSELVMPPVLRCRADGTLEINTVNTDGDTGNMAWLKVTAVVHSPELGMVRITTDEEDYLMTAEEYHNQV